MVRFQFGLWCLVLLWTSLAEGAVRMDVVSPTPQAGATVGVGSRVELQFEGDSSSHSGLFLGDLVAANGRSEQRMLLDLDRKKVLILDRNEVVAPRAR